MHALAVAHMIEIVKKRPVDINVELTTMCPYTCCFCCNRKTKREATVMPLELFRKIIAEYAEFGGGYVGLSSMQSDVFMDPFLLDRIGIIATYYPNIRAYTTNTLLSIDKYTDEELSEILHYMDYIQISVLGVDVNSYKMMAGFDGFFTFERNLYRVKKIIADYKLDCKIELFFRTNDVSTLRLNEGYIRLTHEFPYYSSIDTYFDWHGKILPEDLPSKAKLNRHYNGKERSDCVTPISTMSVQADGKVVGCGCVDWLSENVLGDCNKQTLQEIWKSEEYAKFKTSFSGGGVPSICEYCGLYLPIEEAFDRFALCFYNPTDGIYYSRYLADDNILPVMDIATLLSMVNEKKNIICYGMGQDGEKIGKLLLSLGADNLYFADSFKSGRFFGRAMITMEHIKLMENVCIIIASRKYQKDIYISLIQNAVDRNKIYDGRLLCAPSVHLAGGFDTFEDAVKEYGCLENCEKGLKDGYANHSILDKVYWSMQKLLNGETAFVQDGLVYESIIYNNNLTAALFYITGRLEGKVTILDFGGSLGSVYFAYKSLLKNFNVRWCIVEQHAYVEIGRKYIPEIEYYDSVKAFVEAGNKADCLLLSGVLQYLDDSYAYLDEFLSIGFKYIIIDRLNISYNNRNQVTLQYVPADIVLSIYPCQLLCLKMLVDRFERYDYEVVMTWENYDSFPVMLNGRLDSYAKITSFLLKNTKINCLTGFY